MGGHRSAAAFIVAMSLVGAGCATEASPRDSLSEVKREQTELSELDNWAASLDSTSPEVLAEAEELKDDYSALACGLERLALPFRFN